MITKNNKKENKLLGVLRFSVEDVIKETKDWILVTLTNNELIWLPISKLWLNKVKTNVFMWPIYSNDDFKYTIIDSSNNKDEFTGSVIFDDFKTDFESYTCTLLDNK